MAILDALSRMHMAAYCSQTVNDTEVKLLGSLFSKAMENEDNPRASLESQEKVLQEIISHGKLDPFDSIDTGIPILVMTRSRTKQTSASPNIVDSSLPKPTFPLAAEAVKEKLDKDTVDKTMVEQEAEDNIIPAIPSNKILLVIWPTAKEQNKSQICQGSFPQIHDQQRLYPTLYWRHRRTQLWISCHGPMGTLQGDCTITAQSPYQWTQEI